MIRTYLLNINELDSIRYNESDFSKRRKEKIESLKLENGKKLSIAAELLLIYAVKEIYSAMDLPLDISEDVKGKPKLMSKLPLEDEYKKAGFKRGEIFFSISHSNEYAACAISNEPVGVDIEWIKRAELQHPERILHLEEAETLAFITNPLEKKKYFFECWTLKESYLKNLGIGLVVRSCDFLIAENRLEATNKKLKPRYAHCCKPGEVLNTDWKFDANYKISYCTVKKDQDVRTEVLSAEKISNNYPSA